MPRPAVPADLPDLGAFLRRHADRSMFLLSNLAAQGLDGGDHPHAMRVWVSDSAEGVSGVLALTRGGIVLVQCPGAVDWAPWAQCLAGAQITGLNGDAAQVDPLAVALGLRGFSLWAEEPLMVLDLARMQGPFEGIRPPGPADHPLLTGWFAAYGAETGTASADRAPARAQAAIERGTLRLLIEDGAPTAMADLNARAGDRVQVGGVFVPPEGRRQGRAGRMVAALLAECHAAGVARAVLFAASAAAQAAYARIGFAEVGRYRVALLDTGPRATPCR